MVPYIMTNDVIPIYKRYDANFVKICSKPKKKNELNKNIYLKRMIQHKIELKTFEGFDWASQSSKVL